MQISQNSVVIMNYTLTDDKGKKLDESQDSSFAYLHGASNIIPGLEKELEGKQAGDSMTVTVDPAEGYGERNDAMVQQVSRDMFEMDDDIQAGMQFHAASPDGQTIIVTVTSVEGDDVTIDGNHPLAGVTLTFAVNIVEVRDASEEEIAHGHVHSAEGCAH
jgi:FKBP-type peptidyl-prolyl cis-trans isomerase SlyD